jgi:RNA-directed DNA polymerase
MLMGRVAKRVTDKRVLTLIRAFLTAGVMDAGLVSPTDEGTPHGGPLSPLLSNLLLDDLDRELESRGHRFVRYADDCNIYVRSQRAGQRVLEGVTTFLTQRLKLRVNREKSAVARPAARKFLGFSFTTGSTPKRRIAPKAITRFKARVRILTQRTRGVSLPQMVTELAAYLRGWRGYFAYCETPTVLRGLDSWPPTAPVRRVETMEARPTPVCGTASPRDRPGPRGSNRRESARPVAPESQPGAQLCTPRCLLRLARPPSFGRSCEGLT